MIRHVWSVLCQIASFDSLTNNVSLLSVLENIITMGDPDSDHPAIVQAELVSLWARADIDQPASGKTRIHYVDPNGVEAPAITFDIDLAKAPFHRTRLGIPGLPVTQKGVYKFKVECQTNEEDQWSLVAEIPLIVIAQQPVQQ